MPEILDIIDENNNVIGKAAKEDVLKQNLMHRGVAIFVFNSKREIFVHKRVANKIIYPSMWDMTCGGGVISGEDFLAGAKRETTEEVGIIDPELEYLFTDRYKTELDNVIAAVYKTVFDGEIIIEKEEIEKGFFVSLDKLNEMMKTEKFCPDSLQYFEKLKN
ncbi:MAG: NUDIX domain-containing protein [bacterium]